MRGNRAYGLLISGNPQESRKTSNLFVSSLFLCLGLHGSPVPEPYHADSDQLPPHILPLPRSRQPHKNVQPSSPPSPRNPPPISTAVEPVALLSNPSKLPVEASSIEAHRSDARIVVFCLLSIFNSEATPVDKLLEEPNVGADPPLHKLRRRRVRGR